MHVLHIVVNKNGEACTVAATVEEFRDLRTAITTFFHRRLELGWPFILCFDVSGLASECLIRFIYPGHTDSIYFVNGDQLHHAMRIFDTQFLIIP